MWPTAAFGYSFTMPTVLQSIQKNFTQSMWLAKRSFLQQFPSYSNRKCKKSPFSRTAAHIFVSPRDAPAIITQCVAWMERQFNACKPLAACTYLSSIVSELYDA